MIRNLFHDPILLARKSEPAGPEDLGIVADLLDTFQAHRRTCVGMAANMIGVYKRIIVLDYEGQNLVMLNPVILTQSDVYDGEESCLSLLGGPRKTLRYRKIKVKYQNLEFRIRIKTFTGWTAQIIQHEMDHCNGVLI